MQFRRWEVRPVRRSDGQPVATPYYPKRFFTRRAAANHITGHRTAFTDFVLVERPIW